MSGWLIGGLVGWLAGWLVDWLIEVSCLFVYFIAPLYSRSARF